MHCVRVVGWQCSCSGDLVEVENLEMQNWPERCGSAGGRHSLPLAGYLESFGSNGSPTLREHTKERAGGEEHPMADYSNELRRVAQIQTRI